jgi:DNA (cytosine-5)-methyltransferase 1
VSWCSGIGGFELGIERAAKARDLAVECAGYSDIDKNALAMYERQFPNHEPQGDLTTIDPAYLPDIELFVAGFPCQAFSIAGKRAGFDDTRGTIFFHIARLLAAKLPQTFILENVRGLLSHDSGRTFGTILRTLDGLGYDVQWQVLNSKNFGLPQSRERVYIVGNLGGTPRPQVFPLAGSRSPYSTVGLTTETAVARTLTAGGNSGGNHSGMTVIRTPDGDRRLTARECERLQGFPDDWTAGFADGPRKKACGNAVSVPVVEAVAGPVLDVLA